MSGTLATGGTVGRYRILGFLGAGAMGEVYLAEDPHIERKLAIKTVRLAGRAQEVEERTRRLLREARAAGRLLHPHVVTLFDAGETDGLLYLAFELVEGTDLAARLETSALSLHEVLRIVRETALALDFAHRHGIVHRDIKPSNILLDAAGRVKVADFGIAKVAGQSTELTVEGSVVGSPQYLSPEQVKGEELDGRSDVFSLGVVLYELLSGKRPFDGDTITTLVYQILHKDPPPIGSLRGDLPPRLETLLARMLAKERDERLATAGLVAEELAAIERELPDETLAGPAAGNTERFIPTRVLPGSYSTAAAPAAAQAAAGPVPSPAPVVRQGRGAGLWLALAAVLLLVAGGGTWMVVKRFQVGRSGGVGGAQEARPGVAGLQAPAGPHVAPASESVAPEVQAGGAKPAAREDTAEAAQPSSSLPRNPFPGPVGEPVAQRPPQVRTGSETPPVRREEPVRSSPTYPAVGRPSPPPPPDRAAAEPAPAAVARELTADVPAAADAEPAADPVPADRRLSTGLYLAFRVTPPDAHVLLDRRRIGRADEYSGLKGTSPYQLPGPGEYLIRLRKPGMRDYRIAVDASGAGTTTQVVASLKPIPTEQLATEDLGEVYRVQRAIALRVEPPGAMVAVDGQEMGSASRFSGGRGRPDAWLVLPPGRHRVTLSAPGYRRRDIAVEVGGGAERERQRIEVRLVRGGSDEG